MNQYKMLCLDIDGTLLNSKHQITKQTKEAISKVIKEQNALVILVSARMPTGIFFLAKELELAAPIICYSGALIMDKDQNILFNHYIELSYVKKLYSIVKKYSIGISLYKDDEWYSEEKDKWVEQEEDITKLSASICDYQELFTEWENEGCNKILCMGDEQEIAALQNELFTTFGEELAIYLSKPTYLEIMSKKSSKTVAIAVLLEKYKLDRRALMAIGDNYNDINMIEYAGVGIAMGNAPDEVKGYADHITTSNDEEGVAKAIYTYMLRQNMQK